jgi:4-hydroxyacetophenone monooxygenase
VFQATDAEIDAGLREAQLIAILPTLAYLTGDLTLLRPELISQPLLAAQPQGGLTAEQQEAIRLLARQTLIKFRDSGGVSRHQCSQSEIQDIMSYTVGAFVSDDYVPLMLEELSVTGEDLRQPKWSREEIAPKRSFKVLIVGAGMSGILAGYRLKQAGIDFEILEKNADVGGTWLENRYPGCRVDSANHVYSYSFAQRSDWPLHFSTQDVLLEYFRGCVEKFDLATSIRFQTQVKEMEWVEAESLWRVSVQRGPNGPIEVLYAQAVISAVGQLNRPKMPLIKGRESFSGQSFHSANWPDALDLTGKSVAVIGTGASGVQLIPEIAKMAKSVSIYQRTPPWLTPIAHYHDKIGTGLQWLFQNVPAYAQWYRFLLFWRTTEGVLASCVVDPDWSDGEASVSAANRHLRDRLLLYFDAVFADRPDLHEKTVPKYAPFSKRVALDNGSWAACLRSDHVELITDHIDHIESSGIVDAEGTLRTADVIIYATGFEASDFLTPMRVVGRDGADLHKMWNGEARAYLGITIPHFPNFYCMYGPNTNIVANGSIIFFSECETHYILGCIEEMLRSGDSAWDVKVDVHDRFNERVDQGNDNMAWGAVSVNSWYKNSSGRVAQNWPFTMLEYWQLTRRPETSDYLRTH